MTAFEAAVDALFADPNIGEDALWKACGVGAGTAVRIIRKSSDSVAEFGASRSILPSVVLEIRRSEAPRIAAGDLIVTTRETFKIISEPTADTMGLVAAYEVTNV